MIEIEKIGANEYSVTVRGRRTTTHQVTVTDDYHQQLTNGEEPVEKLLERSFRFLLEREPNTAILARFDLPTISRYFPEYEREIGAGK